MTTKDMVLARGYIASGEFNGNRIPQHIQNQVVKQYCDQNGLVFVLSRAEYWINGSTDCQLWASLKEGFNHIVFFSLWQLPETESIRNNIYNYCKKKDITLHFATERISINASHENFTDIEILIKSSQLISNEMNCHAYLDQLDALLKQDIREKK